MSMEYYVIPAPSHIDLVEGASERGKRDMVRVMARQLDRLDIAGLSEVIHEGAPSLLSRDQAELLAIVVREYVLAAKS